MNITDFGFFSSLPRRERADIERKTRKKTYARGETITRKGVRLRHVYFVARGRVKEATSTCSGKEVVYNTFSRGECFGLAWAFDREPSKADFVAIEACEIYVIDVDELKQLAGAVPEVLHKLFAELTRIALRYSDKLYEIRALDASGRTRVEILRHVRSTAVGGDGDFVEIDNLPTHEEIANTIFSHREAVTREISRLKKVGVLIKTDDNLLAANVGLLQKMLPETA